MMNQRENAVEAFQTWRWRRMAIHRWTDRRTNVEVLTQVGDERNMITAIKKRRWEIIGHVVRHGEDCTVLKIEGIVERKTAKKTRNPYIS